MLVAVITCPRCGQELEGTWAEPGEADDVTEPSLQECGSCAHRWDAPWPGFSFRSEV